MLCASDKKKNIDGFLNAISHDNFDNNVTFFFSVLPVIYFLPIVFVNVYSFVYVLFDRLV